MVDVHAFLGLPTLTTPLQCTGAGSGGVIMCCKHGTVAFQACCPDLPVLLIPPAQAHIDRNTPKATVSKRFSRMASMGSSSRQGSKLSALTASCLSNSASSTEPGSLKATPPGPSASQVNAAAALTDQPGGQQGEVKGAVGPQSAQVPEPCAPLQIPPRQQGLEKQNRLKAAPPAAEAQLQLQRPSQPQGRAGGSPGPGLVRSLSMSPAHEPMSSAHRAAALRTAEALQRSQPKGAVPAIPDNSSLHAIAKVLRGVREQRERTEHMHGQNSPGTVQALARTHSFHAAPLRTAKSLDANFSMNWLHDTAHHGLGGHASMKGRGSIDQTSGKGGMGAGLLRSGSLRKSVEVGQRSSQPAGNLFFAPLSIITSDQVACRAVLSGSHLQSPRAHMHHSSHAGDGESQI